MKQVQNYLSREYSKYGSVFQAKLELNFFCFFGLELLFCASSTPPRLSLLVFVCMLRST